LGRYAPLVTYAVQSKGPVLSGLMLDNAPAPLSAYLHRKGYKPVIFDYNTVKTIERISKNGKEGFLRETTQELDDFIKSKNVKVIGFKLYTNGFADSVRIAKELKEKNPKLTTIAGGPQVNWYRELIFEYPHARQAFDILVEGYIDGRIADLFDNLYERKGSPPLHEIPNLIYLQNGEVKRTGRLDSEINDLLFPLYDEEVYLDVEEKVMIPVVEDSRGCKWSKCPFCMHPRIAGKYRERDVERLAEEIEHNRRRYGFRVSRLSGPSPSGEYINKLVEYLPEDCRISAFGNAEGGYDYEKIRDKVIAIFLGIETANKEFLENHYLLWKTNNAEEYLSSIKEIVVNLKKRGIATTATMIVPVPGETSETMERSLNFLYETSPDFVPVLPLVPIDDSPLARNVLNGKVKGMKIDLNYKEKMMALDLDLLQPVDMWPVPPFHVEVDGKWIEDPSKITGEFIGKLGERGMYPLSDDMVLMAYLLYDGLDHDQTIRRRQCLDFFLETMEDLKNGNHHAIRERVSKINKNQRRVRI